MIIEFTVSNFRSIYERLSLSLLASKLTGKEDTKTNYFKPVKYKNIPILKSAVVYGANASGKSNLLKAMAFFKSFIVDSTNLKHGEELPHQPFKLFRNATNEPSQFEIEFIASDNIKYIYGFSFNKSEILEEYLTSYITAKPTEIFIRKSGGEIQFSASFKGPKRSLVEQLQKNHLLLTKAANSNFEQVHSVYNFFKDNLNIFTSNFSNDIFSKKRSYEDGYYRKYINEFLKIADTGIDSFEVTKKEIGELNFPGNIPDSLKERLLEGLSYQANVVHYTSDGGEPEIVKWTLDEESSGTIKLFALAGPIIDILNRGHILIFDEINNSLHPLISEFIVHLFNREESNPNHAQLIFTTHDTTLFNKSIFRRDQIWFTEKDQFGMTQLYSLCSFDKKDVRWDVPFDKWYLSGRFGALPLIKDFRLKFK